MYDEQTMKKARELHDASCVSDQWTITVEQIAKAYYDSGHTKESFIWNMEERAIYDDLADLDNISIMEHHYPEMYDNWLSFQPDSFFG